MPRSTPRPLVDPIELVQRGWDRAAPFYRPTGRASRDAFDHGRGEYTRWLDILRWEVDRGAPVLDLGCGSGVPASQWLSARFKVTGVDLSRVQVERARKQLPTARFVHGSMTQVEFASRSLAAVIALYSIIHVPLRLQPGLLKRVYRWLRPDGLFLAVLGETAYTGVERNWLGSGATMYWSHADQSTYTRWLLQAGFLVLRRSFVPEGRGGHALFLARRPD